MSNGKVWSYLKEIGRFLHRKGGLYLQGLRRRYRTEGCVLQLDRRFLPDFQFAANEVVIVLWLDDGLILSALKFL